MPKGEYAPQQVSNAQVVETRLKKDYPGQRRNYNYVVRLSTTDIDTGEPVMTNEYRTIASDRQLSSQTVLDRIVSLFEDIE